MRAISPEDHLAFLRTQRSASFLQTPAWGAVKSEWRHESLGWYDGSELVGAGLVLYRQLPRLKRFLAYLPEGPVLDWSTDRLGDWLAPHDGVPQGAGRLRRPDGSAGGDPPLERRPGEGGARGPGGTQARRPAADRARPGRRPRGLPAAPRSGWRPQGTDEGFALGQPQYVFQVPLAGRTEADVLAGMNQLWRRNIKKADKSGVEVTTSTGRGDEEGDLKLFHDLYVHTAERDHFTPRGLAYFRVMADALGAEEPDRFRLYLARHEGDLVAATIMVRVGAHAWYSYGASSTEKRDVRGSNAVQWAMLRDAIAAGADVYDLRGITPTLDAEDSHVGLIQFKVGTGGEAVEYAGEWDLPLNKPLYKAFDLYMSRR